MSKTLSQKFASFLDLRIGKILEVAHVENSEKLYVSKVDIGQGFPRQIISGLRGLIPEEEMKGLVVVWSNLKP